MEVVAGRVARLVTSYECALRARDVVISSVDRFPIVIYFQTGFRVGKFVCHGKQNDIILEEGEQEVVAVSVLKPPVSTGR